MGSERDEAVLVLYDAILEGKARCEDLSVFFRRAMLGEPTRVDESLLLELLRKAGAGEIAGQEPEKRDNDVPWLQDLAVSAGLELAFRNWLPSPLRERDGLRELARIYRMASPTWMALPNIVIRFAGVRAGRWFQRQKATAITEERARQWEPRVQRGHTAYG